MDVNEHTWLQHTVRPLIVGAMFGCIAYTLVLMVHLIDPAWNGTALIAGCVLAALEAGYSSRVIKERPGIQMPIQFRVVELLSLLIVLKAITYVGDPWPAIVADLTAWPTDPINILDTETLVSFVLALLAWGAATGTTRDLEQLSEPHLLGADAAPPRDRIASRFMWGGTVLVVLTGVPLAVTTPQAGGAAGLPQEAFVNVLVYFVLGLLLMGQVQYTALRAEWRRRRVPVSEGLARRWIGYGLAFFALAALLAALLPTGYAAGVLEMAAAILDTITITAMYVLQVLMAIVAILVFPLAWLFSLMMNRPPPSPPAALSNIDPPQSSVDLSSSQTLRALLFWIVAVGTVVLLLRAYLRDHPDLLQRLASRRLIRAIIRLAQALWRRLTGIARAIERRLPGQLAQLVARDRSRSSIGQGPFFRLGALSPRERTLYYFLSVLRRAGRQGHPRRGHQTPHEYSDVLSPHLTDAGPDMESLTGAFTEARYSAHPIDRERERDTRAVWRRVRAALRALRGSRGQE